MTPKPPFTAAMIAETQPNAQVWQLTGKMTGGTYCYEFLDTVRENVGAGRVHAVLDLSAVPWTNSTGVGVLASIFTTAKNAGGALRLVGVNNRVESILKVVNLWGVVSVCDSVEDALAQVK